MVNARADLEKAKSEGAIEDAQRDKEAHSLLAEYLGLLQKPATQTAQQKPPQNPPQSLSSGTPKPELKKPELKKPETAAADQRQKKDRVARAFAAGVGYFRQGNLDGAEEQFKNVLELESAHPGAVEYLKRIGVRRQGLADAVTVHPKEIPAATTHEPARSGKVLLAIQPGRRSSGTRWRFLITGKSARRKPVSWPCRGSLLPTRSWRTTWDR